MDKIFSFCDEINCNWFAYYKMHYCYKIQGGKQLSSDLKNKTGVQRMDPCYFLFFGFKIL
ncbi:MAG: hypothetical protein A2X13_03060 [Bacteroidetes bacterium GWC2_33_15]|nr:MAG: hypothetical protein A2X10_09595 [Bacteroidetes bacterium GWA2_33_15]OFX49526.1 MAG: hypothetical protein A2X13_03060 [Bacteroidetes bacterium GWC2_33_15]OFX63635.1 MAG: hypothetical protein A2X15_01165 [Bacteroidetes bacterium GWB2_32_14]OFX68849.1 MAG: hypothetical protein A2X14_13160 [Bacteroidetes bacterium GWD2_33_33]HAN17554.1 hypothetical protein [Bacteroidales bacterium]